MSATSSLLRGIQTLAWDTGMVLTSMCHRRHSQKKISWWTFTRHRQGLEDNQEEMLALVSKLNTLFDVQA